MPAAYEWEQTAEAVLIAVPLRQADRRKPDVQITAAYVKLNCPPLPVLVLDLWAEVYPEASRVSLTCNGAEFKLQKVLLVLTGSETQQSPHGNNHSLALQAKQGHWEGLTSTAPKPELLARRQAALAAAEASQAAAEAARRQKHEAALQ